MESAFVWLVAAFAAALILDVILIAGWRKYRRLARENPGTHRGELLFKTLGLDGVFSRKNARIRASLLTALELSALALWAANVGLDYLNANPQVIPFGGDFNSIDEFGSAIQSHYAWERARECGWCALWNGSQRGGYPALTELHGSAFHPLVMTASLLWGVVNGAKAALVLSFWIAGLAQWLLAKELGLGWLPRLWSAGIAIAGGHLAGRMELGAFSLVLSTAMCSLTLAALLRFVRTYARRDAVLLGITTASALLSGQGYLQIGLAGILAVAFCFFVFGRGGVSPLWKNYVLAALIALLLAAPLLVPLTHFSPNFVKDADPQFRAAQPLFYIPLNLVTDNPDFYRGEALGKLPYPYLYTLYIGWIPVLFALFSLFFYFKRDRKLILFILVGALTAFLLASDLPYKLAAGSFPHLAWIRHPPLIAGLAVPLILALSAYGLEGLLAAGAKAIQRFFTPSPLWKPALYLLLIIPLGYSLQSCFRFSQIWIGTKHLPRSLFAELQTLQTDELAWVSPPFGEHVYVAPAVEMGLKLSPGILPWNWRDREPPPPSLRIEDGNLIRSGEVYAGVVPAAGVQPCSASGTGGYLEVVCHVERAGILTVKENYWDGWRAWMDGKPIPLKSGVLWLEADAPVGSHRFIFRYLPWDAPLGLFLFIIGCALSAYAWRGENFGKIVLDIA
jgi:hypothetical protein